MGLIYLGHCSRMTIAEYNFGSHSRYIIWMLGDANGPRTYSPLDFPWSHGRLEMSGWMGARETHHGMYLQCNDTVAVILVEVRAMSFRDSKDSVFSIASQYPRVPQITYQYNLKCR